MLAEAEARLKLRLPDQVRTFCLTINGLSVNDPSLQIFPLADLILDKDLLVFGICDRNTKLVFDTSTVNEAGQWFIVNADTHYRITFTMASFWSIVKLR